MTPLWIRQSSPPLWDLHRAKLYRLDARFLGSRSDKIASLGALLLLIPLAWILKTIWIALPPLLLLTLLIGRAVLYRGWRILSVRRALKQPLHFPTDADTLLPHIGLDEEQIQSIIEQDKTSGEALIAEWGEGGTLLSHYGPLLGLGKMVDKTNFQPRKKNRVLLVCREGRIAIKKHHIRRDKHEGEVLTLNQLAKKEGFPRLLGGKDQMLYRGFSVGDDLANLMADKGFSIKRQDQLQHLFPIGEKKISSETKAERQLALDFLNRCVNETFVPQAATILKTIHYSGLAFRDLKYGNLLVRDKQPVIVDFDIAMPFRNNSPAFVEARLRDVRLFNFLFGKALFTNQDLHPLSEDDQHSKTSYYLRAGYSITFPDPRETLWKEDHWQQVMPNPKGKRILWLGASNLPKLMKTLRAKPTLVTVWEENPEKREEVLRLQGLLELFDNRPIPLQFFTHTLETEWEKTLPQHDMALLADYSHLDHARSKNLKDKISSLLLPKEIMKNF